MQEGGGVRMVGGKALTLLMKVMKGGGLFDKDILPFTFGGIQKQGNKGSDLSLDKQL